MSLLPSAGRAPGNAWDPYRNVRDAAHNLAEARKAEAIEFLRQRAIKPSDNQARAAATIETIDALCEAEAAYQIALIDLQIAAREMA